MICLLPALLLPLVALLWLLPAGFQQSLLPEPYGQSLDTVAPFSWLHGHCEPLSAHGEGAANGAKQKPFRALILATSHDTLGWTGLATGVWLEELTEAYYQFADNGFQVEIASPKGGRVPVEPMSTWWPLRTQSDFRSFGDEAFQAKLAGSQRVCDVVARAAEFDVVYAAGGWGAGFDLANNSCITELVSNAYAAQGFRTVVGGVCHGPLALVNAVDKTSAVAAAAALGRTQHKSPLLLANKFVTGVTNKQTTELLGVHYLTPFAPEDELKRAGAHFTAEWGLSDLFVTSVVEDGRVITGQNQAASCDVAQRMIKKAWASRMD